jgi:hypothetical protein
MLAPLLFAAACGGTSTGTDATSAAEALDSTDSASNEGAVLAASTDSVSMSMSAPEAAGAAAAHAHAFYQPAGCATALATGATVTYTFKDCTGPWGLVHVTGTVVVSYSLGLDGLHATATASDLSVNGATVDINAAAVYQISGTTKTLTVTSMGAGTGARGTRFARQGAYTVSWDGATGCGALDGEWSTTIAGLTWSTTVSGLKKCVGMCPAAGGTVTHVRALAGVTLTIRFDGSDIARWSSSSGLSGTVDLLCR